MVLSIKQQDELHLTGEIPPALSQHHIPGSTITAATNGFGQVLLQELNSSSCALRYNTLRIERKTIFQVREEGPFLGLYVALQNDLHLELEGLGNIHLKEGQYNLLYSPDYLATRHVEAGREYIGINLRYKLEALEEMQVYFPKMKVLIGKIHRGEPARLLEHHGWVTREIQDTIFRIVRSSKYLPGYAVYFDLLVKTLLFHLMLQSVQQQPRSMYTHHEINGIHEAREMISRNIKYHYRIPEIAQKVGMNEFKLKTGFREVYGDGLYEYLLTERMREARNLLHDAGRNVKEVAGMTGYKSVNSFIKAFKRTFHQTPGEFRSRERDARAMAKL